MTQEINFGYQRLHPEGTPRSVLTEGLCNGCRCWFPAKDPVCPLCGWERPRFNKRLRAAMFEANRAKQLEAAKRAT